MAIIPWVNLGSSITESQKCLSDPPKSEATNLRNAFRNDSQSLMPTPRSAGIDSQHTFKQSGPTFGFSGALRLELRVPPGHPS